MMFEKIKKNCPKAWDKFVKYAEKNLKWEFSVDYDGTFGFENEDIEFLIGHLFRFFDEQGIHVVIEYVCRPLSGGTCYRHELHNSRTVGWRDTSGWYKSRPEAWSAAFTKAFEILEEK